MKIYIYETKRFLEALDSTTDQFTWQVFRDDRSGRANCFNGSIDDKSAILTSANINGCGVFVTVNQTNLKGRKQEDMVSLRAIWQDDDNSFSGSYPLEPHIIVETSPGKFQRYWLTGSNQLDDFDSVQQRLVQDYGCDKNATGINRVLRVPGFYHQKDPDNPFLVRIVTLNDFDRYPWEEIKAAFPPVDSTDAEKSIDQLLEGVRQGDRNTSLARLTGHWISQGLDEDDCQELALEWNRKNTPPMSEDEVITTVESVFDTHERQQSRTSQNTNIRQTVIELASSNACVDLLFSDDHDTGWARYRVNGGMANHPISSSHFKHHVNKLVWDSFQQPVRPALLSEVVHLLQSMAIIDGPKMPLSYRCAWRDSELFIDLGSDDWSQVRISASGWETVSSSDNPPLFKRYSHMKPLPVPTRGGNFELLRPFIQVQSEEMWRLLTVWLTAAFLPNIPRPGIMLYGQQGAGKSFLSRILRTLVDPSAVPLLSLPSGKNELLQILDHHYILPLDNLRYLKSDTSDEVCKSITGAGTSKRQLFTDADDIIFSFKRLIILNGINIPGTSPDLLDRMLLIELGRIDKSQRRPEQEMLAKFNAIHASIFGCILDALSAAMRILPTVSLQDFPRMADFSLWGYAIAEAMSIGGDNFIEYYRQNALLQHQEVLHADPVAYSIRAVAEELGSFTGTATELWEKCKLRLTEDEARARNWPKSASAFSRRLNQVRHTLLEAGVEIEFVKKAERLITVQYKT